jgi:hypothetical protein
MTIGKKSQLFRKEKGTCVCVSTLILIWAGDLLYRVHLNISAFYDVKKVDFVTDFCSQQELQMIMHVLMLSAAPLLQQLNCLNYM